MRSPKVSVLMPVYNGGLYLKDAIDSILSQTYTDFELVIVNDGSTDCSEDIIFSYRDDRIRYIKNEKNLKIVESLNKGLRLCKGEYIARMDADDIAKPERLEVQVKFMDANSDVGVCGSAVKTFGVVEESWVMPTNHSAICSALAIHSCLLHPTVIFRSSVLGDFGTVVYQDKYLLAEDYDLWTRLSRNSRLHNLPQELLFYRIIGGRDTYKKQQAQAAMSVRLEYLHSLEVHLPESIEAELSRYFLNDLSFLQQKALFAYLINAMSDANVPFFNEFEKLLTEILYTSLCCAKSQSCESKIAFLRYVYSTSSIKLKIYFTSKLLLRTLLNGK